MNPITDSTPDTAQLMEQILYEVKRVVVGQDRFLEHVMVAILAQGHLLDRPSTTCRRSHRG